MIVLKLKQDIKYRGYVYFESVRSNVIYQALTFWRYTVWRYFYFRRSLKQRNGFFSDIDVYQDAAESFDNKITLNETENGSVENALSMRRTMSNETVFISEIPYITNDENVVIGSGLGKKPLLFLKVEICEE